MKVEAVQNNNTRRHSCLRPMAEGAIAGTAVGIAAKYILPIQPDEKQTPEYQKVMKKIHTQKNEFNERTKTFIDTLKAKEKHSAAEDQFIKLFDDLKEGDHVKITSIRKALKDLEQNSPFQVNEFKRICKATLEVVEQTAKQCASAYNLVTKHIRPTGFFIGTGAVMGALVALTNDILKTEVRS